MNMRVHQITFINGIILILLSLWGYFGSPDPSLTALIPAAAGLLFLILTPSLKKGNRLVAHIVVALTFLILIALLKPLYGASSRKDTMAIIRVTIMMLSSLWAMGIYIRSFIQSRRKK